MSPSARASTTAQLPPASTARGPVSPKPARRLARSPRRVNAPRCPCSSSARAPTPLAVPCAGAPRGCPPFPAPPRRSVVAAVASSAPDCAAPRRRPDPVGSERIRVAPTSSARPRGRAELAGVQLRPWSPPARARTPPSPDLIIHRSKCVPEPSRTPPSSFLRG
nr:SH3 domain-containing protein C23A1.17-like [Aegilops tauschii subsp. strangulata]